jgi:hypothetical protein
MVKVLMKITSLLFLNDDKIGNNVVYEEQASR